MNHPAGVTFLASTLALTLFLNGCAGWHAVKGPSAEYIAREKPDVVRLALGDSHLVLSRPVVSGDSVAGLAKGVHPRRWTGVPAGEIRGMEVHNARGSTGAKIAAGSAITVAVLFAVLASRSMAIP